MTPSEARSEIASLATGLLRCNLAAAANTPMIGLAGGSARITWPAGMNGEPGFFSSLAFGSINEYRKMVAGGHYIALLNDGGLLQLSIDIANNEIVGHRFGFFPCPILLPDDFNMLDFEAIDVLLMYELEADASAFENDDRLPFGQLRLRSPLRFDYAPDTASADEPASHVHLLNDYSRIAVQGPISVGHFVQFIFKHFYPKIWSDATFASITRWPIKEMNRCISAEEECALHINYRSQLTLRPNQ